MKNSIEAIVTSKKWIRGHSLFYPLVVNFINVKSVFRTNVVLAAFSSYVLALGKNSYGKFARLTLMKLTLGGHRTVSPNVTWAMEGAKNLRKVLRII